MPFLLPLLLQLGFGLTPFQLGSLTFATAAGALRTKFSASTILRWFGFRRTLIVNGLISVGVSRRLRPLHPIDAALDDPSRRFLTGGFFCSLEFTALNAISYADIDPPQMSRATSFASVSQQMSGAVGVAVAAISIQLVQFGFGDATLDDARPLARLRHGRGDLEPLGPRLLPPCPRRRRRSVRQAGSNERRGRAGGGGAASAIGATTWVCHKRADT